MVLVCFLVYNLNLATSHNEKAFPQSEHAFTPAENVPVVLFLLHSHEKLPRWVITPQAHQSSLTSCIACLDSTLKLLTSHESHSMPFFLFTLLLGLNADPDTFSLHHMQKCFNIIVFPSGFILSLPFILKHFTNPSPKIKLNFLFHRSSSLPTCAYHYTHNPPLPCCLHVCLLISYFFYP